MCSGENRKLVGCQREKRQAASRKQHNSRPATFPPSSPYRTHQPNWTPRLNTAGFFTVRVSKRSRNNSAPPLLPILSPPPPPFIPRQPATMATSTTRIQAAFAAVMLFLLSMHSCALAQGIASKPAQQTKENRISANNTVLLLLDHQVRTCVDRKLLEFCPRVVSKSSSCCCLTCRRSVVSLQLHPHAMHRMPAYHSPHSACHTHHCLSSNLSL